MRSTLCSPKLIYRRPILARNEIRMRRFAELRHIRDGKLVVVKLLDNGMNDNWWEWEQHLEISPDHPDDLNRQFNRVKDRTTTIEQLPETPEERLNARVSKNRDRLKNEKSIARMKTSNFRP